MSSESESASDDNDTTYDESDAEILPVPSALANKTLDTTEVVATGQSTRWDPLNLGSACNAVILSTL